MLREESSILQENVSYIKWHHYNKTYLYPNLNSYRDKGEITLYQCQLTEGIWCDFDRASSLICGNKTPTRCNRGFYCRSYCSLNMFRAPLCPSSGAQEYYTVLAVCRISCCKNVKNNFVSFCGICVLSLKCRVLSRFVTRCVECRGVVCGCSW